MDNNQAEQTHQDDYPEAREACTIKRLSKQLTEYEMTCIDSQGRAKQYRKERDVERSLNEKLRKEVDKLSNQLLCERMRVSCLEKELKSIGENKEDSTKDIARENGNILKKNNKPCLPNKEAENLLTLKLQELQTAIEDSVGRQPNNKKTRDQFMTMSLLIQSLQNYMEVEQDDKDKMTDSIDASSTAHRPLTTTRSKREISMWFRVIVYLGPVFLSILCYIAFNTAKR